MSSIFRVIETFFLISLGITFILVLLLVFHFKMRLLSLEGKHDTTLEIINNIVGELQHMKKVGFDNNCDVSDIKKVQMVLEKNIPLYESNGSNGYIENRIVVSDDSDDESDDESGNYSDECTEVDVESDDESGNDSDEDDVDIENDEKEDIFDIKIIKLSGNLESQDNTSIENVVKTNILDTLEIEQDTDIVDDHDTKCLTDGEIDNGLPNFDDYRKLNVQSLKSIAILKGLSPDPSKLKKKELLNLLA